MSKLSQDSAVRIRPQAILAIATGGVIVGVLDLLYAIVVYSPEKPTLIPQTIASGVLGTKAYAGGIQAAALGVVLHFVIALGAATVYYLASRRFSFLLRRPIISGLSYGALVYGFMHLVVLPLSAADHSRMPVIYKLCEFVEHWFLVGLPVALSVRHFSRSERRTDVQSKYAGSGQP